MKCMYCGTKLIHGGDHDGEQEDDYDIVSNLSCPKCDTHVYVYHTFPDDDKESWADGYEEWVNKQQGLIIDNKEPEMWEHYCDTEKSMMEVGKGEPCNWCGKEEKDCESCA